MSDLKAAPADANANATPVAQAVVDATVVQAEAFANVQVAAEDTQPLDESTLEAIATQANMSHGTPRGLAKTLAQDAHDIFGERIWIVDNSGSMSVGDGHKVVQGSGSTVMISTTRWDELGQAVITQSQMAVTLRAPTTFRLLNPPARVRQVMHIGTADGSADDELRAVEHAMRSTSPWGCTPLTRHINEIRDYISGRADALRTAGKQIVVVIATDGVPSDDMGNSDGRAKDAFVRALQSLHGLPVHLMVRLCTDVDEVGDYWNDVDKVLELPLDVLDDYVGEAEEIHKLNPWLNYGMALHAAREFGLSQKVFDLLDERPLLVPEIKQLLESMFGWRDIPEPALGWKEFSAYLTAKLGEEGNTWNPITKKEAPWVDLRALRNAVGGKGHGSCIIA